MTTVVRADSGKNAEGDLLGEAWDLEKQLRGLDELLRWPAVEQAAETAEKRLALATELAENWQEEDS